MRSKFVVKEKKLPNYANVAPFLLNLNSLSTTFSLIVCFLIIIMNWYLFVGQTEMSNETKIWSDAALKTLTSVNQWNKTRHRGNSNYYKINNNNKNDINPSIILGFRSMYSA